MIDNKNFWMAVGAGLLAIYGVGLLLALQGQTGHILVRLCAIILLVHLLEIPLALKKVKDRQPNVPRVAVLTFIFGLVFWIPASRGVFPVK